MNEQFDHVSEIADLRRRLSEAEKARDTIRVEEDEDSADPAKEGVERFCRRLLEQMREGSIELGPSGVILHCNRQFREMIGRPAAQLIGDCILDHVAPEQAPRFAEFFKAPEAASREFEFLRADGALLPVSVSLSGPAHETSRSRLAIVTDLTQMKWMERSFVANEALREREKWSRLAVAAGGVGTFDIDLSTGSSRFSVTMHEILGLAPDREITLDEGAAMMLEDDKRDFAAKFRAACDGANDGEWSHEMRIRRGDGAVRWIAIAGKVKFRHTPQGRVAARSIGTAIDVTDRKEIEDSLRRSNERLRLALAAGAIGNWEMDVAANVTDADLKYRDIYGFAADAQITPELVFSIVSPEDVAFVKQAVHAALDPAGDGRYQAEYRIRRPSDGLERWVASRAQAIFENGRALRLIGVASDITEKKSTERELRGKARLAEQLACVAASVPGLIASFRLEPNGKTSLPYTSPNVEDIYGLTAEALSEDAEVKFARVHPDDLPHLRASIAESARTMTVWRDSYRYDHPRKGWIWIEAQSSPTRESDGAILWHGYLQDVTERKRIEAALIDKEARMQKLHAERLSAVGELATGLAHELNQPLSATTIYLKAARRLLQMPPELRPANVEDTLDNASTQIIRAGQIIGHLREFVTRGEPDKTIQSLHDLINEANELVMVEAKQTNIQVVFQLNAGDDRILADRVQIKQVVVNLMRNAKDAMSASKRRKMIVSTSPIGKTMIKVDVADTGSGLAEETRASLFEPFTTTKANGMGVGLSIARSIVEAHYGKIWAGPNRDGGATFSFTLPLTAMETEA